jgi:hypothetical protein
MTEFTNPTGCVRRFEDADRRRRPRVAGGRRPADDRLVLVSPTGLPKADLVDVGHLLRVTPMPLLGLIVYRPARLLGRLRRRAARPVLGVESGSTSTI